MKAKRKTTRAGVVPTDTDPALNPGEYRARLFSKLRVMLKADFPNLESAAIRVHILGCPFIEIDLVDAIYG